MYVVITRIVSAVFFSIVSPLIAAWIDPALNSQVHLVIIGLTAFSFMLSERFFRSIVGEYKNLHNSAALTSREAQRLENQVTKIRSGINFSWGLGFSFRLVQIVIAGILYFTPSSSLSHFYLVLAGYLMLGASVFCLLYFWGSARKAGEFKVRFDEEERVEKRRQEVLEDFEKTLVKS